MLSKFKRIFQVMLLVLTCHILYQIVRNIDFLENLNTIQYTKQSSRINTLKVNGYSQGAVTFDFSHLNNESFRDLKPTIPHIIHLVYNTHNLPLQFKPWIQSLVRFHPSWQFWIWTLNDTECLIRRKYSDEDLKMYRRYKHDIFRADALRYFLLYEYGGFYIDLDVEALKPLDVWTYGFDCAVSQEIHEHSYLVHHKQRPNIMTTVLATRPKHPFFRLLYSNLAVYQRIYPQSVLYATGPFYLDAMYHKYLDKMARANGSNNGDIKSCHMGEHSSKPSDIQGCKDRHMDGITVLHSKYWLPTWDPQIRTRLTTSCKERFHVLPASAKRLCTSLQMTGYTNKVHNDSFLDHKWAHINTWSNTKWQHLQTFNVFQLIPGAKNMTQTLCDK